MKKLDMKNNNKKIAQQCNRKTGHYTLKRVQHENREANGVHDVRNQI